MVGLPFSPHVRRRWVTRDSPTRPSISQQECCLRVTEESLARCGRSAISLRPRWQGTCTSNYFGTAQGRIIGRLHERYTELLGVFGIAERPSSNGFRSSMWVFDYYSGLLLYTPSCTRIDGLSSSRPHIELYSTVKDVVLCFGGLTMGPVAIGTVARWVSPETSHDRGVTFFDKRARCAFGELSRGQSNANGINSMDGRRSRESR